MLMPFSTGDSLSPLHPSASVKLINVAVLTTINAKNATYNGKGIGHTAVLLYLEREACPQNKKKRLRFPSTRC